MTKAAATFVHGKGIDSLAASVSSTLSELSLSHVEISMTAVTGENNPVGSHQPIPDFGPEALGQQEVFQACPFDLHSILPIHMLPDLRGVQLEISDGPPLAFRGSWRD